jgi:hypothetical protein
MREAWPEETLQFFMLQCALEHTYLLLHPNTSDDCTALVGVASTRMLLAASNV